MTRGNTESDGLSRSHEIPVSPNATIHTGLPPTDEEYQRFARSLCYSTKPPVRLA
jgi:hypothetical protein